MYRSVPILTLALLLASVYCAWGHGGHGKPEIQFKVVPREIKLPNKELIRMGDVRITRKEYFDFVRNISAFQLKADLFNRNFLLHFWVIEGISRYYPEDINPLMIKLQKSNQQGDSFHKAMQNWSLGQADQMARLFYFYRKSIESGRLSRPDVRAVIDAFEMQIKADFVEELVTFATMNPTVDDVRKFAATLTVKQKKAIHTLYKDPDTIERQGRLPLKHRWIQYRRDMFKKVPYTRDFLKIQSIDIPGDTVLATVGKKKLTLNDFRAIQGPVQDDAQWNQIKQSRCSKWILNGALAQESDNLGLLAGRYKDKIDLAKKLFLSAHELVLEFGAGVIEPGPEGYDFEYFRRIAGYRNLVQLEKLFLEKRDNLPGYHDIWIDRDYLSTVQWFVGQVFTPRQPMYF